MLKTFLYLNFLLMQPDTNFVLIPSGTYILGKQGHPVNPEHKAVLDSFYISKYEVTNAEFKKFVDATGYITVAEKTKDANIFYIGLKDFEWDQDSTANWRYPNGVSRGGIENKMNHPVTSLCYFDIQAYCKWAGVRLPTLDEWEVACRAGTHTTYFFGEERDSMKYYGNVWFQRSHQQLDTVEEYFYTAPVGSFKPNPWGLYDMYGNVFEMCSNVPKRYKGDKQLASARGGSWWCSANSCNFFNSVDCGRINKLAVFSNMGFRVVKDISKQ
jgi:sulfatase modifying factor 1